MVYESRIGCVWQAKDWLCIFFMSQGLVVYDFYEPGIGRV